MKKFLLTLLVAAVAVTGAFAQGKVGDALKQADAEINKALDQFPKGTWVDSNWDALWVFGVNNTITLKDAKSGAVIYNFTPSKRSNFKINATNAGLEISFRCEDTKRTYKFTKPVTLDTSITMDIDYDLEPQHYTVNMKFKN